MPAVGLLPKPLPPTVSSFELRPEETTPESPPRKLAPRTNANSEANGLAGAGAGANNEGEGDMAGDGTDADSVEPETSSPKAAIDSNATASTSATNNEDTSQLPPNTQGAAQGGYYLSYPTPEPPSPAGHGSTVGMYDMSSFLPAAFLSSPFPQQQYISSAALQQHSLQPPLSPSQKSTVNNASASANVNNMSHIPPASPLFPRVTGTHGLLDPHRMLDFQRGTPLSPSPSYLNSPGGIPMYPAVNYAAASQQPQSNGGAGSSNSPEEYPGWGASNGTNVSGDNRQTYSPQIGAQGMPIPYVPGMPPPPRTTNTGSRSQSFDDSMLSGAAIQDGSQQEQGAAPGSYPYGGSEGHANGAPSPGGAGTLFSHQQAWGFGGLPPPTPHDMYNPPASPLQPRPTYGNALSGVPPRIPNHHHHPHMVTAPPYGGQYFPATSPGPPIQTTSSNKGPDGANLFIFHIPNHFTNIDMYQLFCPYGNLLSVRIMVQKETGRSRGFGFVSYDSPDAAALAIKELNGFAIGNKRLKVQHKQIRPSDHMQDRNMIPGGPSGGYGGVMGGQPDDTGYGRGLPPSLPPSGPMSSMASTPWYGNGDASRQPSVKAEGGGVPPVGMDPQHQDGAGATSPLHSMDALRQTLPDMSGSAE